ncbi:50S ribosomal protein L10 [Candidatus Pacearchaeota archaeon]|nr:50S ribosomal protein L10 [Candidatus Pacearchaeota archaeon]
MVGGQKVEAHVSEVKKSKVKELVELMKRKTVMVISIKGLPSAQFQDIKKKLRDKAGVQVTKKNLVNLAFEESGIGGLKELGSYVDDSTAMLFSDEDAFVISGILADEKSPAKAKAGQIAPFDIEVKAGPTELLPGPDISALSAVGLAPKVESGKIAIMKDKVILGGGKEVTEAIASIMAKLDIIPFEVGVEPVAAYMDGKVYVDIKIDREKAISDLEYDFGRAFAFAVDLGIVNSETLNSILGKASVHEGVVSRIISGEPEPVVEVVQQKKVEVKEETKKEKPVEAAAGLASLFG